MVNRESRVVLITSAERSQDAQLRSRQRRYLAMMSVRAVCLVAVAVLYSAHVPLLGLWVAICVAGMVLLPWIAVLVANDRPPKRRYRVTERLLSPPPGPEPATPVRELAAPRIIDAED